MKTIFLIPILLLGTAAFGQYGSSVSSSAMTSTFSAPDHAWRATRHGLGIEYDLRESSGITMGQGELPAWEIPGLGYETPLGDAARDYRKEHASALRAHLMWEQNGDCPACLRYSIWRSMHRVPQAATRQRQ
jgi:hypothetical protein